MVEADDASIQNLTTNDEEEVAPKSTGGRPKGTTNAYSLDLQECIMLAKHEAANEYSWVRSEAKQQNKAAPWGSLPSIVNTARAKYDIPKQVEISVEMIQTWAKSWIMQHCSPWTYLKIT